VPQVGAIRMWARNPPIPLNSALGNPINAACFEHLALNLGYYPTGHGLKKVLMVTVRLSLYLDDKGDNDEPYGNSISGVRAIQHVRICPHSHGSHVRTDPIHAAASVVLHPNQRSP